ncbi:MAG: hypothetical protein FRX48_00258 [Lasallia pustulata]|uniref:Uncharacterized protein n=1 Tax=Lasallia pustulata TaxID=136370 RepID=A0A5M8Q1F8_9LECA|nr:MAG: hypothetical protein FRX48_00258 [Lasallia pustulata]
MGQWLGVSKSIYLRRGKSSPLQPSPRDCANARSSSVVLHKRHREATMCCFAYDKDQGFRAPQASLACSQLLSLLLVISTQSYDVLQPRIRESIDKRKVRCLIQGWRMDPEK